MLVTLLSPLTANAQATAGGVDCGLPESDAEALVILNNYYPNRYTWDHTNLTIAVQAQPGIPQEHLDAIDAAIATWAGVLQDCFDGLITLTEPEPQARGG